MLFRSIFRNSINSYKELPKTLYHIQWKFRDEVRPRFGVMRGREFLMKDGYSFDVDEAGALHSYNRHLVSYLRTYERMGLKAIPMRSEEHTSELQSRRNLVCRLLLEKKNKPDRKRTRRTPVYVVMLC